MSLAVFLVFVVKVYKVVNSFCRNRIGAGGEQRSMSKREKRRGLRLVRSQELNQKVREGKRLSVLCVGHAASTKGECLLKVQGGHAESPQSQILTITGSEI